MSLDKWLNSEDQVKDKRKKPTKVKKGISTEQKSPEVKKVPPKLVKYKLNCPNSKCKYQKIVMKKKLTDIDKLCPRCNKEMKVKIL